MLNLLPLGKFLLLGILWVVFFIAVFNLVKKMVRYDLSDTRPLRLLDVPFFLFSIYAFANVLLKDSVANSFDLLLIGAALISLSLFGFVSRLSRPYFRYGVIALVVFGLIISFANIAVDNWRDVAAYVDISMQGWGLYQFFATVLFPIELGEIVRRILVQKGHRFALLDKVR